MAHVSQQPAGIEVDIGDLNPNPTWERAWDPPLRVFLSHTSELRALPRDRSYVAAAEAAVLRAGHAVADMAYFATSADKPADYCMRMVARADVYVGIIGLRYGALVPGLPGLSYTECEFKAATTFALPRLMFLIRKGTPHIYPCRHDATDRVRQQEFRDRLQGELTIGWVASPADLELGLYHALVELKAAPEDDC